jgi:pimeloyl-ACP methyl ester carboxylesterase
MSSNAMIRRGARPTLALSVAMTAALVLLAVACTSAKATVWLCKPGAKPDPCTPGLSTTVYNAPLTQATGVEHPKAERNPPIDCFYVYPTVSDEKTGNSDLQIQDTERSIATYQVGRYSQYCKVYAPMYRQVTLAGAGLPGTSGSSSKANPKLGVSDVENALEDYLKHYNHGRGFVLIGHSQGSGVLESVIAKEIDPKPAVRKLMLSAILMGGNVLVKGNTGIGGDFKHIPACRSSKQLGCVIAFSTFDQPVPSDSLFGRPGAIAGFGPKPPKDAEVLCTNPANLAGGSGLLDPITPSAPFAPGSTIALGLSVLKYTLPSPATVFWASPHSYTARCEDSNGAHVLEITARNGAQTPTPAPTPEWGLHLLDANLSLGNLISVVASETKAFVARG